MRVLAIGAVACALVTGLSATSEARSSLKKLPSLKKLQRKATDSALVRRLLIYCADLRSAMNERLPAAADAANACSATIFR